MGILDSITGAKAAKKGAKRAEKLAEFQDFSTDLASGQGTITKEGLTVGGAPGTENAGQFADLAGQFISNVDPTAGQLDLDPNQVLAEALTKGAGAKALGQDFLGAAGSIAESLASFDPRAFATEQFDALNQLAARGEETAASKLANRLFSGGRLGGSDTQTGNVFGELERAQQDARTQRGLAATQSARDELASRTAAVGSLTQSGIGATSVGGMDLQQFLSAISGGQQAAGFQQAFEQSQLQSALGATGGVTAALAPENINIANLLSASGLIQTSKANQAGIAQAGGNAQAAATGNFTGSLLSGLSGFF
jgi:hypothetical protein